MKPRHLGLSPGAAKRAPAAVARAYADIEAQLPGLRAASAVTCPTRPGCNACCRKVERRGPRWVWTGGGAL